MAGPRYVTLDNWVENAPNGVETGSFIVEGEKGDLSKYSIVIYKYNPSVAFTKTDDVNDFECRSPGQSLTYSICLSNDTGGILEDAYVIDWLADEVKYPEGFERIDPNTLQTIPADPYYDPNTHSYVWPLGDIAANESFCLDIEVVVDDDALPGTTVLNVAELWVDNGETLVQRAIEYTPICCWQQEPGIIYVDQSAVNGNDNGTSWRDAYLDLADALEYAGKGLCSEAYTIYIAEGIYDPNNTPDKTFEVPADVSIYGGFPSGGTTFKKRNPKKYETILTGLIKEED